MNEVAANIQKITQQLPAGVKLVAVTKTKPVELIMHAYHAGLKCFAENKVQELVTKQAQLPNDVEWHLIGHLQTNKVKYIAPFVGLIQSVDSLKLLQTIQKEAEKNNRIINCLLQLYIATEDSKFGLDQNELFDLLAALNHQPLPNVNLCGLMGIASNTNNQQQLTKEFNFLLQTFHTINQNKNQYNHLNLEQFTTLSMGMSADYGLAITCGSNLIRVGSAIFGERNYNIL